jgi:putative ABC transport system permease protein
MSVIITLSVAVLWLLFIAITNYANLNMSTAVFSDKYLRASHVFGSSGRMKMRYFLSEGIIIALMSIAICGFITSLAHIIFKNILH